MLNIGIILVNAHLSSKLSIPNKRNAVISMKDFCLNSWITDCKYVFIELKLILAKNRKVLTKVHKGICRLKWD